jgi:hypothetical protein
MLAECVDAVVGVDTHRDTHQVEIASPTGTPIATLTISNDSAGYAELLAWIFQHTPGPRVVVSIEGTRSYGAGLARAVAAVGLVVIECEQPNRKQRRGIIEPVPPLYGDGVFQGKHTGLNRGPAGCSLTPRYRASHTGNRSSRFVTSRPTSARSAA